MNSMEAAIQNITAVRVPIKWTQDLPVFASEPYLKSVSEDYGWIGGKDESENIRCILPYAVIHISIFRMVRFFTEIIPLVDNFGVGEENSFLDSVIGYFRLNRADMIIPSTANALFRTYPKGSAAVPYGTYIADLSKPEDILWNNIYEDFRKNIRRATKSGVLIKSGNEFAEKAYNLLVQTLKRSSLTFRSQKEFERILACMGDNIRILVAEYEGGIQACMVIPFSRYSAYSLFSGRISTPVKGAMHLLQWEAIRQMREIGVERFNFMGVRVSPKVGSKQEGIKNFKMRFGGNFVQGYMWKYPLRNLKCKFYSVAIRTLRGSDVVDQEAHNIVTS